MRAKLSTSFTDSKGLANTKFITGSSWPWLKKHLIAQTHAGKLKLAIDRDDFDQVRALLSRGC